MDSTAQKPKKIMEKVTFDEKIMAAFLSRHDMIYEKPATEWPRGLPMGNSTVSTFIWGTNPIKVSLDRADFWEIRNTFKPDPEQFRWRRFCEKVAQGHGDEFDGFCNTAAGPMPNRFPVGRLEIDVKGKEISDYYMRLHLHDATAEGHFTTECGSIAWNSYVSADLPVIIFNYRTSGGETARPHFKFSTELGAYTLDIEESRKNGSFLGTCGYACDSEIASVIREWGYPEPVRGQEDEVNFYRQVIPENGSLAVAWTILSPAENETTIVVGMITDRKSDNAERQAIDIIKQVAFPQSLATLGLSHKAWWHNFYPKSFVSFPDTRLEGFYWVQMYMLGCTSRPDGIAPSIGGVWSTDNGWSQVCGNDYHWNMNNQGNLMPIYTANRLEMGFSIYDMLERARPAMAEYCRMFFECDGEFLAHCTDIDGRPIYCNPDQFEFCSLPWMCQLMWLHYKYSMDEDFLRQRLYPMMRKAARPMLYDLRMGEDGKLHLPCTSSPEYHGKEETFHFALGPLDWTKRFGPDATVDLAFLRFLCQTLLETVDILKVEDEDRPSWENTLRNLTPYHLDVYGGLMVRGDVPAESSHRHLSHLFPIHPLHLLNMDNPEDKALIERSLLVLAANGTGEWMGWSYSQAAMMYIIARHPAVARMLLLDLIDKILYENTFYMQGSNHDCAVTLHHNFGPTIEAALMGASAIMDFMCRSYNNTIYVFDSVPEAWDEASFWHLRTEGAFLVSARRKEGRTEFIALFAEKGGTVRLVSDLGTEVEVRCENQLCEFLVSDGRIVFETEAGKEYLIFAAGSEPNDYRIAAVRDKPHEYNFFGLKKHDRY